VEPVVAQQVEPASAEQFWSQHCAFWVHEEPLAPQQTCPWQLPPQQSPSELHAAPVGLQQTVELPPLLAQFPLQHPASLVQVAPFALQQTPSLQLPLQHPASVAQLLPRLLQHVPPEQLLPEQQSEGPLQDFPSLPQHVPVLQDLLQHWPFPEHDDPEMPQQEPPLHTCSAPQLSGHVTVTPQLSTAIPLHWPAQAAPLS
jgi:hypothetical protein